MVTIASGVERWAAEGGARVDLGYAPFPKQQQFHASPAKYRLFGGAAGPGKTKALLMEAILQAHEHPGANTLLLRRTFPELEQSLLLYFRREVPRELYRSFHEAKHVVTWWNGSTTRFGYCQSESDVYQYQGGEFLFIGVDELTMFTLRQWQFLTSRNRCPVPGAFPCMAGATNPGNIGHAWVKSLWIDRQAAPGMEHPEEYDADGLRIYSGARVRQPDLRTGRELSEDAAGAAIAFAAGVSRWRLGCFRRSVFRPIRFLAACDASGRDRLEAVVATVDLGRLGIRASGGGVLACGDARHRGGRGRRRTGSSRIANT